MPGYSATGARAGGAALTLTPTLVQHPPVSDALVALGMRADGGDQRLARPGRAVLPHHGLAG